ncbi:hypothetical protein [Burkholderia pseudomallei]|uniref:hypothetical protein n=1 Tax=Burkholderia pseudomallei TaxID=28450 RepID=UPI0027E081ED|nr:hypothetical protein [Burkholderia pseudomallei]
MSNKLGCFITSFLVLLVFHVARATEAPSTKGVSFSPLTISIACGENTAPESHVEYLRASGARPEVNAKECLDKSRTIDNILPSAAKVEYSEVFHVWLVAIVLRDKDALAVKKLSADNVGSLMVVSVNHKALSISQLGSALSSNKIYINADSKSDAHNLMMRLTKP